MITNVIDAIKFALEQMDQKVCELSKRDYSKLYRTIKEQAKTEKYLERPIAYEFYHQLRKLTEKGTVDFGGAITQAEVDKRYQHCFKLGKVPDFIIHIPNSGQNLAVIEIKLTSNFDNIKNDLLKLSKFKENTDLRYDNIIQVVIGDTASLEEAKGKIRKMEMPMGSQIDIIQFNTDSWKVTDNYSIRYKHLCEG